MALPIDLVFIRHGESEANIVQDHEDFKDLAQFPDFYRNRHNAHMRLSEKGAEQARITGQWLKDNYLDAYDYYYCSPHIRTRETAANLSIEGNWRVDDRWRERDWGEYGIATAIERTNSFPYSKHLHHLNKWYWTPNGGESLASGVRLRFNNIIDTLYRHKITDRRVIGVTHGEFIRVAQFVLEKMDPEDWESMHKSDEFKIRNAMVVHYSRRDPETGEVLPGDYSFRRGIVPWDESLSWNNGEWAKIKYRRHSDADLMASVEKYPRLLDEMAKNSR